MKAHLQLLLRDSADHGLDDLVHYAYVGFQPYQHLSFRLGRNPLDIFLLSDYRNVGFAYPWVRPVNGMYSTLFSDYYEGIQMTYSRRMSFGDVHLTAYTGILDVDVPLNELLLLDFSYEPLVGINLVYERAMLKLIAGYQKGRIEDLGPTIGSIASNFKKIPKETIPLAPYVADYMNLNDSYCDYISLGISYDDNSLLFEGEISRYSFDKGLGLRYNAGYVSVGYRVGHFLPFIVYSKFYNEIGNVRFQPDEEKLARLPQELLRSFYALGSLNRDADAHQDTLSLGVRWNLGYNYALKFQWDHNWIKKNQTLLWQTDPAEKMDGDAQVNVFSVSFDFFF